MASTKKSVWAWLLCALIIFAAGFIFATFADLDINISLYSPHSMYAILMECFGWWWAFLPAFLLLGILAVQRGLPKRRIWQPILCILAFAGGLFALYRASYGYMKDRGLIAGIGDPVAWVWLFAAILFGIVLLFAIWRIPPSYHKKLLFVAIVGTIFLLANQVLVYPLKTLWARTRFDDMFALSSFSSFTPWYLPLGNGGSSFPSGHTANAAGIFCLLFLCDVFPRFEKRRGAVLAICWVYIAAMAFARILIGRHFLSDTLAASGLMAIVFYIIRHNAIYKKELSKTLSI